MMRLWQRQKEALRAQNGGGGLARQSLELGDTCGALGCAEVVGVVAEGRLEPSRIRRVVRPLDGLAPSSKIFAEPDVADPRPGEPALELRAGMLRISPGAWESPNIGHDSDGRFAKQRGQLLSGSRPMSCGMDNPCTHAAPKMSSMASRFARTRSGGTPTPGA